MKPKPTLHSARQLDKSALKVTGEIKFDLNFGSSVLSVDGLVHDKLDCDILAGVPFCKANNIDVFLKDELISLNGTHISYGSKPPSQHDIYRTQSVILRNDSARVIYPGDFVEVSSSDLSRYEGEVAVEPRFESPLHGEWPQPSISRVIHGTIRIPNQTTEPILLTKHQHFAQIRLLTTVDNINPDISYIASTVISDSLHSDSLYSNSILLDPDDQLTRLEKRQFANLHKSFDNVFSPAYGAYNDHSGKFRATVTLGPVKPPSSKPRLPFYNHSNLSLLQDEADKLEKLGVLAKPEDVGVEVLFVSPSFLIKKPSGEYRFVTTFNELGQYCRTLPSVSNSCNDVLRKLASWAYIIKTDMTKSFFQIPVSKSSIPYLGTITPFKGIRVYLRSAMGMPGSSEHLNELLSRVIGDLLQKGMVIILADDLHVCGNSISELLANWSLVLQRMQQNNLTLSPAKTVICPKNTTILGWKWSSGSITVSSHKLSPLITSDPPKTCTAMRSYIGTYKAIARCIPRYSSLISPLEESTKGLEGSQLINWTSELSQHFMASQNALKSPRTLTIPKPSDKLTITTDASPVNDGISATLYLIRNDKRLIAEFFSMKLKVHQRSWGPCELEALAITAAIRNFAPYIRDSHHPIQVLTDSKPCVQAHHRLLKGHFSASSRVSTFLSSLSEHNVILTHIKGDSNKTSDYGSRHPNECADADCQICKYVEELTLSVVQAVTVSEVLSGSVRMPFLNSAAWRSAQHSCQSLRRVYAHLTQGTRPSKKARHIKDVRQYLRNASINEAGLIIVRKPDQYVHERRLIVVPKDILLGLLTAMHLYFGHASTGQLSKVFHRYFYAIKSDSTITETLHNCSQCESMKTLPKELFSQSTGSPAKAPGQKFAADVICRTRQKILVVRDTLSSYTTASFIPDETAGSLRTALLHNTSFLRTPTSTVRVDGATGFLALKEDKVLQSAGITLDIGQLKNVNKNPVAEKSNQELEQELLRLDPNGSPITLETLDKAVNILNSRVRNRGLSSKEIITHRDQVTSQPLQVNDVALGKSQLLIRQRNHYPSGKSKARGGTAALPANISHGSLVYLKDDGSKVKCRDMYLVIDIADKMATIQKISKSGLMSKRYQVPLEKIYPAVHYDKHSNIDSSDTSSTENECDGSDVSNQDLDSDDVDDNDLSDNEQDDGSSSSSTAVDAERMPSPEHNTLRRSSREHRQPSWLRSGEWTT